MKTTIILFLLSVPVWAALAYVVFLIIKALRKYIRSEPLRQEKAEQAKTLGETLKRRRTACKMTQEFVAEALGVSRQAVSKWESGAVGSQHDQFAGAGEALWREAGGAAARGRVTA